MRHERDIFFALGVLERMHFNTFLFQTLFQNWLFFLIEYCERDEDPLCIDFGAIYFVAVVNKKIHLRERVHKDTKKIKKEPQLLTHV